MNTAPNAKTYLGDAVYAAHARRMRHPRAPAGTGARIMKRRDYFTFVAMTIGHRLTVEESKLVDHYRLYEGVTWKEAAKRLERRETAMAQDAADSEDHLETRSPDPALTYTYDERVVTGENSE